MKSKIIFIGIVSIFYAILSGFQMVNGTQSYTRVFKKIQGSTHHSQIKIDCTQCHGCTKDESVLQDSITLNSNFVKTEFKKDSSTTKINVEKYIERLEFTQKINNHNTYNK